MRFYFRATVLRPYIPPFNEENEGLNDDSAFELYVFSSIGHGPLRIGVRNFQVDKSVKPRAE